MGTKVDFLYLSEPDMVKAGVKDMKQCVEVMERLLVTLNKGDYVMGGKNHNSHGCMIMFPDDPQIPGMPKNADERRFMAMPAYLGGEYQMAGMKWYGSNVENKKQGLPRSILMMMLNDKDTGAPLALMSANLVSSYRTGGIPGVGAKYLARKDAKTVAIVGPGVMGKTSLAAFVSVCPNLDTLKIKGRGQKSIDSFIEFTKKECPQIKNITVCDTLEEAVRDSDIISMTTVVRDDVASFPYINGEWVESVSGKTAPTYNPANGEILAEVVQSGLEDVERAVAAAKTSFYETRDWRDMDSQTRGDILLKIADLIDKYRDELARIESMDMGKPLREVCFRYETIRPQFLAAAPDVPLTPAMLAQLLASTQGGRKAVGDREFYAVLNRVDTPELQQQGIQIQQLLRQQGIPCVLTHFKEEERA